MALEPDVAGTTRVERPVDVELADGVAGPSGRATADVTGSAGVELPCVGALWDRLDDTGADGDAAGSEVGVEAEIEVEPLAELESLAELEPPRARATRRAGGPAEPALPVEPEPSVEPEPTAEAEPPAEDPPPAELPAEEPPPRLSPSHPPGRSTGRALTGPRPLNPRANWTILRD